MATLWIVHRDAAARGALARSAELPVVSGDPADPRFETAREPDVVLLGLRDDFEPELEFAHRFQSRYADARWLLLAPAQDTDEARRLFDTLAAEWLPDPPAVTRLRRALYEALARRRTPPLSQRRLRDRLAARFARWFADLDLPELLRALDPRLADLPLLVCGEAGTGRSLLARYVHLFGWAPPGPGAYLPIPCDAAPDAGDLLERITAPDAAGAADGRRATVCLEEVDRLALAEQREVAAWIELGLPTGFAAPGEIRWMATGSEDAPYRLDPRLEGALAGLRVALPPLRARPRAIAPFVAATARAWCEQRSERARSLAPETLDRLLEHPWPGNLRELEAVVLRSLAASGADPLGPGDLRFLSWAPSEEPLAQAGEPAAPSQADEEFELTTELETEPAAPSLAPEPAPPAEPAQPPEAWHPEAGEAGALDLGVGDVPGLAPELEAAGIVPEPEAPRGTAEPAGPPASTEGEDAGHREPGELSGFAAALAETLREPTEALRRLGELLPGREADAAARLHLADQLQRRTGELVGLAERLERFAALRAAEPRRVNLSGLLDEALEQRRATIEGRRLLVLKELDRELPFAFAAPEPLRLALDLLLDHALATVPERGDLYLASRYQADRHPPRVRVLLRLRRPGGTARPEREPLAVALARAALEMLGGRLRVDAGAEDETVVLFDLPGSE